MKDIDDKARETAFTLQMLMAEVDFKYNRHHRCIGCGEQYKHHEDYLPCITDTIKKKKIKKGEIKYE